jgi:hypothetical protein
MRIPSSLALPVILMHLLLSTSAAGSASVSVPVSDIDFWQEKQFEGETDYQPVVIDGTEALKAHSMSSASGLYREQRIDLHKTPFLNWRWRVDRPLAGLEERTKRGDDYAARVYVVIDGGLRFWKTRALNYVWSSNMAPGSSWNNAFAGPNVRMLALRNNSNPTAEWFTEKRNILADLRHQFGDQIRYVDAIAIMTDTDNSMGEAISYYSDMYFSEK